MFEDASSNGRLPGISSSTSSGSGSAGTQRNNSGGLPDDPLADCDLRAYLPGYTSSRASLYNHQQFDNFDVGTITLHRITGDEGHVVSALSLKAPKDARKNFDKGQEQTRAHKTADAAASFRKAVTTYPQYADAWLELGKAQLQLGAKDDARSDFQKAMGLDDKLLGAWQQLGYLASDQSDWPAASKYLDQAVRLDPIDSAMAWYFDAMANYNLAKYDVAERSIRAEMKLDTGANPRADFLLGMVLIARKDIAGGATVLRKFVDSYPEAEEAGSAKKILASAERVLAAAPQQ
jgi:tetratricopeptide (TPR) repeat protein